jgi:hypothetical protein
MYLSLPSSNLKETAMFNVNADFIGDFKLGDNINYNLKVLNHLYDIQTTIDNEKPEMLRKPIIVLLASIAEALLYDLHQRVKEYTIEGVTGMSAKVITYIRGKQIDKFELYISSVKKHNVLGPKTEPIYDGLHELRKIRNRVHIQNENNDYEANDAQAFSAARQKTAESSVEVLMKTFSKTHPRKQNAQGHVKSFALPWNPRLP